MAYLSNMFEDGGYSGGYTAPTQTAPQQAAPSQTLGAPSWVNINGLSLPVFEGGDVSITGAQKPTGYQMGDGPTVDPEQDNLWKYTMFGGVNNSSGRYGDFGRMSSYDNNYRMKGVFDENGNLRTDAFDLMYKSGDKQGSNYSYVFQNGKWTPTAFKGVEDWNTNNDGWKDVAGVAAVLGGTLGANALFGGLGAAGAGAGAGVGTTAGGTIGSTVGQGTLAELMAGGLGTSGTGFGVGTGATTLGAGVVPTGAAGTLGGSFGGLSQIGTAAGAVGGSLGGMAGSGGAGMTGGSFYDTIKQGYDTYNKVKKGYNMYENLTNPAQPPQRTGATGGTSWLQDLAGGVGGLADIWGAVEGSRQTKDMSGNLKKLYDDALQRRQPYLDRLNESYINPNSFYDSNQWKGLESVYQNSLDRGAAKTGRMANPTDREVKLNNYAMQELEKYRGGLRDNAQTLSPNYALNPMISGIQAEARANNPWGALLGEQRTARRGGVGGTAGGIEQVMGSLAKVYGGIQNIPQSIKDAFGFGSEGSIPGMDYGSVFGGSPEWGPMAELPNYLGGGFGDVPTSGVSDLLSGFDLGGGSWDDLSEWF